MAAETTRRRFLGVVGLAAAGSALWGLSPVRAMQPVRWRGQALGAEAALTLYHPDPDEAAAIIAEALDEVAGLERVFSLHRPDSALSQLNREGRLTDPPAELVEVLRQAALVSHLSDGAFDVTVQPLWSLYAQHFAQADADPAGPDDAAVRATARRVGWARLQAGVHAVSLCEGMQVTLNGIAQGFITDRVTDLLRRRGVGNVLVDMGEYRGVGGHADGRPFLLGLADPADAARILAHVPLRDHALSTSSGAGTRFDKTGRFHHLFDPARGRPAGGWAGVTVAAPTATLADALSTAIAVAPMDQAGAILRAGGGTEAWLHRPGGGLAHLTV